MLKLESLPIYAMKEGSILAYLNEPEEKGAIPTKATSLNDLESDIPF